MSRISNDGILEPFNDISDQQAIDSDFGGNSDAENAPYSDRSSIIGTPSRYNKM